jgi:hypothetical protein
LDAEVQRGGLRGARSVQKLVWIMKSSMAPPMEAPTAEIFRYQPANLMIWFARSESSRAGVAGANCGGGGGFEVAGDAGAFRRAEADESWPLKLTNRRV